MKHIADEKKITDFFGDDVFSDEVMRKLLDKATYDELNGVIKEGGYLHRSLADKIAPVMMSWAVSKGATHFTHWFQPMTGTTAEKHDCFISIDAEGAPILEFSGKSLTKGEADASSFPSGGIRATFEARGYTAWDCSSPAFIKRSEGGTGVLYIPTAFCSYTGLALDKKTPLLRSMEALNREGVRILKLLGEDVKKVVSNVGAEQEYFLITKKHYMMRDDLKYAGRTLFGAPPAKGQEKNDQYYGVIRDRVSAFMADLDEELWRLGITAKTEHNEVAPAQHELAPIYATANIACDQNQLIMEVMKKVAEKNDLVCLLHEKPFKGLNGSGKHNNWSVCTDSGDNLLDPGLNPQDNLRFLLFITAVISGVDEYAGLVRMSAAHAGNDQRLGGHEAPPATISIFVGEMIENAIEALLVGEKGKERLKEYIRVGVPSVPKLKKDVSDRNRTSPFAFTGNKFEFRMVGSSASISTSTDVLNTVTAEMLSRMSDEIEARKSEDAKVVVIDIVCRYLREHKRVIYNGNNYGDEWKAEAKRRGLINVTNSVDAAECLITDGVINLFGKHQILSREELISRYEIYLEDYSKTINIEALAARSIAKKQLLPVSMRYAGKLADYANALHARGIEPSAYDALLKTFNRLIGEMASNIAALEKSLEEAQAESNVKKKATRYRDKVLKAMDNLRATADELEVITDKKEWPFPSYGDILFYD